MVSSQTQHLDVGLACQASKAYEQKNSIYMVKHGGGPVMLWGCFAVAGSGNLDYMKDILNSLYQAILAKMVDAFGAETEA